MTDSLPSNVTVLRPVIEILPCPFCGETDAEIFEPGSNETDVCLMCPGCEAMGPATRVGCRDDDDIDLEAEAIALWNQRAAPSQP